MTEKLTESEIAAMKEAMAQTDAIFALEGFEPTANSRAIDAAVLAGRVTHRQVIEEMVAYASEHKSIDGFIESRTWA